MAQGAKDERIEEAMIRQARESFQPMPTLEMIIDRLVLALAPEFKTYCSITPEIDLISMDYMTYEDAMEATCTPSLIAVTAAEGWKSRLACAVEPDLLFTILEVMLGGRRTARAKWVPRSFTAFEKRIGGQLAELALTAFEGCCAGISPVHFDIRTLETNPRSVVLVPPGTATLRVRLRLRIDERDGHLSLILPYGALEEVGALLAQPYLGGRPGGDSGWRNEINSQISGTTVKITALLRELPIPLHDVMRWQPGDVIDLGMTLDQPVVGMVNEQAMFQASFGQRTNGSLALRVTQMLLKQNTRDEEEEDEDAAGAD